METLPKDVRRKIALELSPADIVRFCLAESESNKEICQSDAFWRLKIQRDFPDLFYHYDKYGLHLKHPKNTYLKTVSKYRKAIEDFSKKYTVPEEDIDNLYQSVKTNPNNYISRIGFIKKYPIPKKSISSLFYALEKIDGHFLRHGKLM